MVSNSHKSDRFARQAAIRTGVGQESWKAHEPVISIHRTPWGRGRAPGLEMIEFTKCETKNS